MDPAGAISANEQPPPPGDRPPPHFPTRQLAFVSDFELSPLPPAPAAFDIFLVHEDGSDLKQLTFTPERETDLAWSPDGQSLAFVRSGQIHVIGATGGSATNLSNRIAVDSGPTWSPDGSRILFRRTVEVGSGQVTWKDAEVYVMNADGTAQTNLSKHLLAYDGDARWSPDGNQVVFASRRDGNLEIYRMNADGSDQVNLTNHPEEDRWPDWSPQGGSIAFTRGAAFTFESHMFRMAPDGSVLQELTLPRGFDRADFPRWSPDGKWILALLDTGNAVWVFGADGLHDHEVLAAGGLANFPHPAAWSNDGTRVAAIMHPGNSCPPEGGMPDVKTGGSDGTWTENLTCPITGELGWETDFAWRPQP
jgi:TolB protein